MKTINDIFQSQLEDQLSEKDDPTRSRIIKDFVQQQNPSRQDIINELTVLKGKRSKSTLALNWLRKEGISREDLSAVLDFLPTNKLNTISFQLT